LYIIFYFIKILTLNIQKLNMKNIIYYILNIFMVNKILKKRQQFKISINKYKHIWKIVPNINIRWKLAVSTVVCFWKMTKKYFVTFLILLKIFSRNHLSRLKHILLISKDMGEIWKNNTHISVKLVSTSIITPLIT